MQLRLRAPTGTRVERTEVMALTALKAIRDEAGQGNVEITLGYVGPQPASYPINTIYLGTKGPGGRLERQAAQRIPASTSLSSRSECGKTPGIAAPRELSFEAGDIVTQIMNFGAPTPIEVAIAGRTSPPTAPSPKGAGRDEEGSELARSAIRPTARLPTVNISIDRERAGQRADRRRGRAFAGGGHVIVALHAADLLERPW